MSQASISGAVLGDRGGVARVAPGPPPPSAAERYRLLALALEARLPLGDETAAEKARSRVVVVTSPTPGDGKTTTAIHLAAALARELGRNVVLVDGDLRRPRLASVLGFSPPCGVGDVLRGAASLDESLWRVGDDELWVLPGTVAEAPRASRLAALLAALRGRAEWVLVDTPALSTSADAVVASRAADGVLLVVRTQRTLRRDLFSAASVLARTTIVGCVLNGHPGPWPGRREGA